MKRKGLFIFLALIMFGAAGFFYVTKVAIPVHLKNFLIEKLRAQIQRPVTIESIAIRPLHGIALSNIKIFDAVHENKTLIEIDRLTFNVLFVPLFKKQTIIIPTLSIEAPYIRLVKESSGAWNLADLWKTSPSKEATGPRLLLRKLIVKKGELLLLDQTRPKAHPESIKSIAGTATLMLNKDILFSLNARMPKQNTGIALTGAYDPPTHKLTAQLSVKDFPTHIYAPFLPFAKTWPTLNSLFSTENLTLTLHPGGFEFFGHAQLQKCDIHSKNFRLEGDITAQSIYVAHETTQWELKAKTLTHQGAFAWGEQHQYTGNVTLETPSIIHHNTTTTVSGQMTSSLKTASFHFKKALHLNGPFAISDFLVEITPDTIKSSGQWQLAQGFLSYGDDFQLNGQLNIQPSEIVFQKKSKDMTIKTSMAFKDGTIQGYDNRQLKGDFNLLDAKLTFTSENIHYTHKRLDFQKSTLFNTPTQYLSGNPRIDDVVLNFPLDKKSPFTLEGVLHLNDAEVNGIAKINAATHLSGSIPFTENGLSTTQLKGSVLNTALSLEGSLKNYSSPQLNVNITADQVNLATTSTFIHEHVRPLPLGLTGTSFLKIHYDGPLLKPSEADVMITTQIHNAALAPQTSTDPEPIAITNINGEFLMAKEQISWKAVHILYKDIPLKLTGYLENFSRPTITTHLNAPSLDLTLETVIKLQRQGAKVLSLDGTYENVPFQLKGSVAYPQDSPSTMDLKGTVELPIHKFLKYLPNSWNLTPEHFGQEVIHLEGVARGPIKDWHQWSGALEGSASQITFANTTLNNVILQGTQINGRLKNFNLDAEAYGGNIKAWATCDFNQPDFQGEWSLNIDALNLATFTKIRHLTNQDLAGDLTLRLNARGSLSAPSTWRGNGAFQITDGYLWRWNSIDALSGLLMIPEFQNIAFTAAQGHLQIGEGKVHTDDTVLFGNTVNLIGQGWIDLNQRLHFDVRPQFSEAILLQSKSLRKAPTALLTQAIAIRVDGTLQKRTYKTETSPLNIIGNTTNIIGGATELLTDGLQNILEGFF